jgi:hypothetical protein
VMAELGLADHIPGEELGHVAGRAGRGSQLVPATRKAAEVVHAGHTPAEAAQQGQIAEQHDRVTGMAGRRSRLPRRADSVTEGDEADHNREEQYPAVRDPERGLEKAPTENAARAEIPSRSAPSLDRVDHADRADRDRTRWAIPRPHCTPARSQSRPFPPRGSTSGDLHPRQTNR